MTTPNELKTLIGLDKTANFKRVKSNRPIRISAERVARLQVLASERHKIAEMMYEKPARSTFNTAVRSEILSECIQHNENLLAKNEILPQVAANQNRALICTI